LLPNLLHYPPLFPDYGFTLLRMNSGGCGFTQLLHLVHHPKQGVTLKRPDRHIISKHGEILG